MSCKNINIRRARKGAIFGVCQGLADHFELNVAFIRLGFILLTALTTFGFPGGPILYFVLAFIMKPAGAGPDIEETEDEYFDPSPSARSSNLQRMKDRYDAIEARIRRMENHVTDKSYDWERRFRANQ